MENETGAAFTLIAILCFLCVLSLKFYHCISLFVHELRIVLKIVYIKENTEEKSVKKKQPNITIWQPKFWGKSPLGSLIKKLIASPVLMLTIAIHR